MTLIRLDYAQIFRYLTVKRCNEQTKSRQTWPTVIFPEHLTLMQAYMPYIFIYKFQYYDIGGFVML